MDISSIYFEITLMWMPQNIFDDLSTLVPVMVWCRQAKNHYMGNIDPDVCRLMTSLGHNKLNNPPRGRCGTIVNDSPAHFLMDFSC